jgi:hypothetical protein
MTYDYKQKKIVAVINTEIERWQALNVLGHMAVSLGVNRDDDLMGREILLDASGFGHKGIARYGFIIKSGNSDEISDLIIGAKEVEGITLIDFPQEMLDTRHDDELCDSVLLKKTEDFKYLGCLLYGLSKEVDTLTKGYALYN